MTEEPKRDGAPKTAVIFVGFNGSRWLDNAIASALDQDMPACEYDVFYVDNDSTDGSAELVETRFPQVRVVRLQRNIGFYAAFNLVAATTDSEYVVAVPQDVVLHRRWLPELVRVADSDPRVLVAVTNTLGPEAHDYDPAHGDGNVSACTWVGISRLGYAQLMSGPQGTDAVQTLACMGCSALLRRELVSRSGRLFDETVGHYAGDVEVGLRASVVGGRLMQVPTAIVYHVGEEAKSQIDLRLLLRYAAGSRDQVLAFYLNMTPLEFALFLPVLGLGLAFKARELRARTATRGALLCCGLVAAPLVVASAFARMPQLRARRQELLGQRRVDRFWLLRRVLKGTRPSHRVPVGLVWNPGPKE